MPEPKTKMVRIDRTRAERHRESIRAGLIIRRLQDHIEDGERHPMSATQIQAARILLAKVAPDLKAVEVAPAESARSPHSLTAAQLLAAIDGEAQVIDSERDSGCETPMGGRFDGGVSKNTHKPPPSQKNLQIEDNSWKDDPSITGTFRGMPVRSREWLLARMPKDPPEGYEYGGVSLRGDSIELVKIDPDAPDPITGKKAKKK